MSIFLKCAGDQLYFLDIFRKLIYFLLVVGFLQATNERPMGR
jgi:hypothetical protein